MLERGVLIGATRLIKRAWQIYVAHIILFVMYVAEIGYLSQRYTDPNLQNEFNVAGFMRNPSETLNQGLILAFKPVNMDVLPLYILLMVFFPPVLWAMLRRPNLTLAGSFLLYLVARHFDWNLHAYPTGWSFKTVLAEDLLHFVDLPLAQVIDFVVLALLFGGVVLCVRSRGEIAAETHRDGAGDHLGEAGGDDYVRVGDRRGKTGRQRERPGQAVGHPDHDVADRRAALEVPLDVRGLGHYAWVSANSGSLFFVS